MTKRCRYLICYDIASPKRMHRARDAVKDYAVSGQKSFYECMLTQAEQQQIQHKLEKIIDPDEDRIHIFQLDPRQSPQYFGKAPASPTSSFIIV